MVPLERPSTLAMVWPEGLEAPDLRPSPFEFESRFDASAFRRVQRAIGFHVDEETLESLRLQTTDDAIVIARDGAIPIGTALAQRQHRWTEIAWVAVDPTYRGRGIGRAVCARMVRQQLARGNTRLHGSTQDERLSALNIYFSLGFSPVFRTEKVERWKSVCRQLERAFAPGDWGWPALS